MFAALATIKAMAVSSDLDAKLAEIGSAPAAAGVSRSGSAVAWVAIREWASRTRAVTTSTASTSTATSTVSTFAASNAWFTVDGLTDARILDADAGLEVFTFAVHTGTGETQRSMLATVQTRTDHAGATVVAGPSLEPVGAAAGSTPAPFPGLASAGSGQELPATVERWAKALIGDDAGALRVVTGDPDPDRTYRTLNIGGSVDHVTVNASGLRDDGLAVARVTFTTSTVGDVTFDVLVAGADTAVPTIVSWGPVGSGLTLAKFSVADSNKPESTVATIKAGA